MVGLCLPTGLRRGELFALRWRDFDEANGTLAVERAVYEGVFGSPKTAAGTRVVPLSREGATLPAAWREEAKRKSPTDLIFSTRGGKPISPNNILRRFVCPACQVLGYPRASRLTFRRTYSSWAHDLGVPQKVVARLMGHANVYTTLNVYTQVLDDSLRRAMDAVGKNLFKIVQ
jgi:integrase